MTADIYKAIAVVVRTELERKLSEQDREAMNRVFAKELSQRQRAIETRVFLGGEYGIPKHSSD